MYTTIRGFVEEYRLEAGQTQKLLDALTDESLNQELAPGYRTLGQLAWHLVHNNEGMLIQAGLTFEAPAQQERPSSAKAIADAYRSVTEGLLKAVETQWTDEELSESIHLFGQTWTKGLVLYIFLKHEIHHRGQMTIVMRQAGVPVIGVYGPSKDEWAAMGAPIPE
ncbi:DinB family protein [Paenibacillus gansuensis]|uniref:DinB family protein n=1 Tax=Paenibacillus gansuensis TaxID=306542 RepID=A0ABW5PKN3_9BACL